MNRTLIMQIMPHAGVRVDYAARKRAGRLKHKTEKPAMIIVSGRSGLKGLGSLLN